MMATSLSRRAALAGTAALAALPGAARAAPGAIVLTAARRSIEVGGRAASVLGILGPDGRPGVTLAPGARFAVSVANRIGGPSIVHWHGQTPPVHQDGVADTGLETLIANATTRAYDYMPRPGTYWMHSHHGLELQRLMAAPLIVHGPDEPRRDEQEIVVMLQDFSFRDPAEILAGLTGGGGMSMPGMSMPGMSMPGMGGGGTGGAMDLNDIAFDAWLANDRTLDDPALVRVAPGGSVRLRIINAAAATAFWLDPGPLAWQVIAADGDAVHPLAVGKLPLVEGQRLDLRLRIPRAGGAFAVLATPEGRRRRTGLVLATPGARVARIDPRAQTIAPPVDLALEARLRAIAPLPPRRPDRVLAVTLGGGMGGYRWTIDGASWADRRPIGVRAGEFVALDLVNRSMMAHPMHLHGHRFQVLALGAERFSGALRDTVLVPPMGRARIGFLADNPGRWLFHCHNLYHMAAGMMTELVYAGFVGGV